LSTRSPSKAAPFTQSGSGVFMYGTQVGNSMPRVTRYQATSREIFRRRRVAAGGRPNASPVGLAGKGVFVAIVAIPARQVLLGCGGQPVLRAPCPEFPGRALLDANPGGGTLPADGGLDHFLIAGGTHAHRGPPAREGLAHDLEAGCV